MPSLEALPLWVLLPGLTVALTGTILVLAVLASYFERRPICPHAPIGPGDVAAPYHGHQARHLGRAGFLPVGHRRDATGRLYRVLYEFWLSSERDVLARVGAGTIAGLPVRATWLYSPLADGRLVVSTDHQSAMEPAPGDPWDWGLRIDASIQELLAWHRERVADSFTRIEPFEVDPQRAFDRMARLRVERVEGFVVRGLARYRDDKHTSWSYSALGSFRLVLRTHLKGSWDAISQPFRTLRSGGGV